MKISKEKVEFLQAAGMEAGKIAELDEFLDSKAAEAEGLEFKEGEAEVKPEAKDEPDKDEELDEVIEGAVITAPDNVELAAAIVTAVDTSVEAALEPIMKNQVKLAKALEHIMKEDGEKIAKVAAETPTLSLAALVEESFSARKSGRTKLSDDDELKGKGPKQAKADKAPITNLPGFEFVDQIVRDSEKED